MGIYLLLIFECKVNILFPTSNLIRCLLVEITSAIISVKAPMVIFTLFEIKFRKKEFFKIPLSFSCDLQNSTKLFISSETNVFLILLFRAMLGIIFLSIFLKIQKKPIIIKTHYPILTVMRGLMFFITF